MEKSPPRRFHLTKENVEDFYEKHGFGFRTLMIVFFFSLYPTRKEEFLHWYKNAMDFSQ